MAFLNPWQLMLWIAGLELISVPLFVCTANMILGTYFKLKSTHQIKFMKALGEVLELAGNNLTNKMVKKEEK